MAQRLINESVLVIRKGKRIRPVIGKAFDLTDDEIKQLERIRPQAISKIGKVEVDTQSIDTGDQQEPDVENKDEGLSTKTRKELMEIAKSLNLEVNNRTSTDKLVELIEAAHGDDL